MTLTLEALSLVENVEAVVQVRFYTTLEGPTEYVNATWMSSLHGFLHGIQWIMFHGYWTMFKNHLVEVGLTQNQETMALRAFTTVDLFYFIMREDPHEQKCIEIALG